MPRRVASRGSDQFNLRLPDGMRDQLKEEADKNGRSLNMEIVARLQESLSDANKISPSDSYAFADGAIVGVLRVIERIARDGVVDLPNFISKVKDDADKQMKSRSYSKSVVAELLRSGGFIPPQ